MSGAKDSSDRSQLACAGAALVTLLVVQIVIGYEWLSSGITKTASGTFVSGLAGDLKDKSQGAAHWYRTFLNDSIVPNAKAFAVLIEVGEIVVGVAFMVAAIVWLTRWSRLSDGWRMTIHWTVMLAAGRDLHGDQLPSRQRRQPSVADPRRRVRRDDRRRRGAGVHPNGVLHLQRLSAAEATPPTPAAASRADGHTSASGTLLTLSSPGETRGPGALVAPGPRKWPIPPNASCRAFGMSPRDSPRTTVPNLGRDRRTKVGQEVVGLTRRGRCPAVAATRL